MFFKWIDNKFIDWRNTKPNLLFYPEGHRNLTGKPKSLKKGMIRYIFERKRICQICIAFGLDDALNESTLEKDLFKTANIDYAFDEPIDPKEFKTNEEFYDHIVERFADAFSRTLAERNALRNITN